MLDRVPATLGNSESDRGEELELEELAVAPDYVPETPDDSADESTSPDDHDGAGEDDPGVVVLQPLITFGKCSGCGGQAIVALLGRPDALFLFETLLHTEKLNLLCVSCGQECDPIYSHDDRQ